MSLLLELLYQLGHPYLSLLSVDVDSSDAVCHPHMVLDVLHVLILLHGFLVP